MSLQGVRAQIQTIITDKTLSVEEQIKALTKMHDEVRAEIRAATESNMVDDNDLGEALRHIDEALESFEPTPEAVEDRLDESGPATL